MAKKFFRESGIEYEEYDVAADIEARNRMIEQSGQMGVPVITVNGDTVIGFDKNKLEQLLGLTKT